MQEYETKEEGNKVLKVFYEEYAQDPRSLNFTDSNLSKFVLHHKRYTFPNELDIDFNEFTSWAEVEEHLIKEFEAVLIKPVSMYEHGGIVLYLDAVLGGFDSGQLGFIIVTKEDIKKEYGKVTKTTIKKAENVLKAEFEIYKNYVEGDVFGFELYEKEPVKIVKTYKDKTEEEETTELKLIDSCWGFYGNEGLKQIGKETGFN